MQTDTDNALTQLREALRLAPEFVGEAYRACAMARRLVERGELTLPGEALALLDRERASGWMLDAFDAARAVREALRGQA